MQREGRFRGGSSKQPQRPQQPDQDGDGDAGDIVLLARGELREPRPRAPRRTRLDQNAAETLQRIIQVADLQIPFAVSRGLRERPSFQVHATHGYLFRAQSVVAVQRHEAQDLAYGQLLNSGAVSGDDGQVDGLNRQRPHGRDIIAQHNEVMLRVDEHAHGVRRHNLSESQLHLRQRLRHSVPVCDDETTLGVHNEANPKSTNQRRVPLVLAHDEVRRELVRDPCGDRAQHRLHTADGRIAARGVAQRLLLFVHIGVAAVLARRRPLAGPRCFA
mmetsp:Transcript_47237/g.137449  ORF Transcript_47237/g.137449 Transcript_47237/m.137449 type:complete len:274 (+) Transcript_47237:939-1760(+)